MADIPGTNVASMITPFTTQDIIATHSETYGQGGYRSEKTVADMNAIIASRRKEGMIVHVLDEDKDYILKDGKFVVKTSEVIVDSALSTTSLNPVQNKVITNALDSKQNSLVSGTSIKTINSVSLLGSGNINIPVITVDSATSSTSTNPLQNRVITASITDINTKLTPISTAWNKKNTANGLLVLDTAGLVPSSNLPSYVDDVLDVYATYDQSATGTISNVKLYTDSSKTIAVVPETGKIYIDVSSGKPPYQFRWSGTAYVTLNTGGLIIGTISGTAFDGGKGQELYSEYAGSRKTIYQRAYSFFNAITPASDKFMQNISASYTATAISLTKAYKNFAGTSSSESLTINAATTSNAGVMSAADKTKLDSYQASTGATPNSIAKRDENGDLTMRYPITNAGVDNSSSIDYVVYISNSATKFMRHCSLSHFTDVMRLVTTTSRGLMSPADKKKLEDIDTEKFLRKDIDDIANGNITFNNGIYVKGSYANLQSIFEQGGNSILEQGGNGIIETAETQAAPTDITLADLANVDGTVNEPAYKRMILTKLAGATTWTQEYIDPLIEITEAPSNDLYYARRNKAWVNFTPFSGNYSDLSGKPTIPTKLANPYALTFSGAVTATYDGSGAVNVNIPVGGEGGGGSVIVDSSLSTTSVNPVQNRVITNAINNANSSIQTNADNIEAIMSIIANIPSISIDTALSTTSTNAVQNKVITAALNSKQNTLVSGTNIKTINSQSIVGSGNVNLTYSFSQITSKPTTLSGYGITDAYTMAQVNNAFVSLSGNVIRTSGKLSMAADVFADDGSTGGLDMRNSNIVGVNGIYFKDASDSDGEYINFYRDSTHVDSLYALNGELRFKPNRVLGAITTASNIILHTGNYTSYVPTKTGTGATGTWAISITGTAELSKATNLINGSYTGSGGKQPPSYIPSGKIRFNMMNTVVGTDSNYKDFILMDSYTGNDVPYVTAIGVRKTSTPEAYIMSGAKGNTTEANWVKTTLLSALNYNNYAPSKTGLGASGTWNINVSGSAASVAWVNVSNKPNFAAVATSGSYNDLTNKPTITNITVDSALSTTSTNPLQNKIITTALNGKQANLVSGTNIKTVGGQSLLGSGNIAFPTITVDSALSSTSTNPLQNKVINSQFESVTTGMQLIMSLYNEIKTSALTSSSVVTSITTENSDSTSLVTSVKSVVSYISDNLIDPITPILTAYLTQNTKNGMLILDSNGKVPSNLLPGTLLTLGTTSTTAFRGDYGNILFTNFGSGTNLTGTQRARNFFGKIDVSNLHFLSGGYTWTQTDSEIEIEFEQYNFTGTKSTSSPLINFPIATTAKAGLLGGDQCSYLVSLNTEYNNIANKANYIKARKFFNSINPADEYYYCGAFVSASKIDIEIEVAKRNFDTSSETYDYINLPAVTLNSAGVLTSTQFTNLSNKQEKLVSGTSIKTINGQSLLGSGNIAFPTITVDSALSSTSTNPLQNKVINSQFESVTTGMQLIMSLYNEIKTSALTSSSVVTSITTENSDSTSLVTSVKSVVSYISDNLIDPITPILTAYLTQNTKNGMLILDSNGKVPSNLLPGTLLTLGTTSTTAFRGDYGNILFTNFGSGTNLTGTQRARNFFGKIDVSNLHFLSGGYTWTQTDSEIEIEFEQYNFTGTKSTSSPLINFPIATTAKAGLLGGDQCSYLVSLNTEYNNIANKANYIKARKFFNSINPADEYYYCGAFVSASKIDIEIEVAKRNFDTSSETYDYINLPAVTLNSAGVLTSTQFTNLSNKQEKLVSGTSIKTINGQSLLGSGNINISGGGLNSYTTTLDIFNISNGRTITSTEFAEVGRIMAAVREGKQILYNYQMAEFGTGVLNCHLADDLTCLSWVVTSYTDTEIFYIDPTLSTDKWARISLVKSDFSNITSKSFGSSSSYYKLPDGLLIQWGMSPGTLGNHKIILPISFSDTNYIVTSTIQAVDTSPVMFSTVIYTKYTGYFYGWAKIEAGTWTAWKFNWIAIGRWK